MPTPTYVPLATTALQGGAYSVNLTGIAQGYKDLVIVGSNIKSSVTNSHIQVRFNYDAAAIYSNVSLLGNGSSAASYAGSGAQEANMGVFVMPNSDYAANFVMQIFDYSQSNKHKVALTRLNATEASFKGASLSALRYGSTNAITSVNFFLQQETPYFLAGSIFTIYGIAA